MPCFPYTASGWPPAKVDRRLLGELAKAAWETVRDLMSEAESLFRLKVLVLLKNKGLLSNERIELLESFRHSGFSVHNSVTVQPEDADGIERMARYLLHTPLSLDRLHFNQDQSTVAYRGKHQRRSFPGTSYDPLARSWENGLARLLMHIPQPRLHTIRYTGANPESRAPDDAPVSQMRSLRHRGGG